MKRTIVIILGVREPDGIPLALSDHPECEIVATIRDRTIAHGALLGHFPEDPAEFIDFITPRLDLIEADEALIGLEGRSQNGASRFYVEYFVGRGIPVTICDKTELAATIIEEAAVRNASLKLLRQFQEGMQYAR